MKDLLEAMAKGLVDHPDQVRVNMLQGRETTVFELSVASGDVGKIIGKGGKTASALRTILSSVGAKARKRYTLEILD